MSNTTTTAPEVRKPVTIFGPDFPFAFDDWIAHPEGLGQLPAHRLCEEVDYLTRLRKWGQTPEDIERDLQGASNSNTGA